MAKAWPIIQLDLASYIKPSLGSTKFVLVAIGNCRAIVTAMTM
jgi:hypothetical protein